MSGKPWDCWRARWEAAAFACRSKGGEVTALTVGPPAREVDIARVENELGQLIPGSMRTVLLGFSRHVEFQWFLPEDLSPPAPYNQIFSGECYWDLDRLVAQEQDRLSWVEDCFSNPDDPYDVVWHRKLGFASVGNGDVIALDPRIAGEPVVYLSHDDGEGHGRTMGRDLVSFIDNHSRIGCIGLDDWQWVPFCHLRTGGIDGDSDFARGWREWFGLEQPD